VGKAGYSPANNYWVLRLKRIKFLTGFQLDTSEIWELTGKETLGTVVKKQREASFSKAIDLVTNNHNSPRLQKLQARRKNPNQKPTNISGEKMIA
jgi:hypothetical protein